jgi:hypothetical protein
MSKKYLIILGAAAVGYALASTLGSYPGGAQAYNFGKNLKQGRIGIS